MAKPTRSHAKPQPPPAALSLDEVMAATGLGRTTLYRVIRAGHLIARKAGRRTVVLSADVDRYLETLPPLVLAGRTS